MGRPRADLADLRLSASPNLSRAEKLEARDAAKPVLSVLAQNELQQIDDLVRDCLLACREGQSLGTKRNPAFSNLESLMRARRMLLAGHRPLKEEDMAQPLIDELDRVLEAAQKGRPS